MMGQPVEAMSGFSLSPDGSRVAFNAAAGAGQGDVWVLELARGLSTRITFSNGLGPRCSPDGKYLLYGLRDILALPLTGEKKPEPYLQTKFSERRAAFSPDGRWLAYDSDESGRMEIYVHGFPERRGKWLISAEGGIVPNGAPTGKRCTGCVRGVRRRCSGCLVN